MVEAVERSMEIPTHSESPPAKTPDMVELVRGRGSPEDGVATLKPVVLCGKVLRAGCNYQRIGGSGGANVLEPSPVSLFTRSSRPSFVAGRRETVGFAFGGL